MLTEIYYPQKLQITIACKNLAFTFRGQMFLKAGRKLKEENFSLWNLQRGCTGLDVWVVSDKWTNKQGDIKRRVEIHRDCGSWGNTYSTEELGEWFSRRILGQYREKERWAYYYQSTQFTVQRLKNWCTIFKKFYDLIFYNL